MKPISTVLRHLKLGFLSSLILAARFALGQPNLVSVQPDFESSDVALDTQIVFVFDAPMNTHSLLIVSENRFPQGSLTFSGNVLATSFRALWNADNTVLTLSSSNLLPPGTEVTWKINPPDAAYPLVDANGNAMAAVTGIFTTAGEPCDPEGVPVGYGSIFLVKAVTYIQTTDGPPALLSSERPVFYVSITSPATDGVSSAVLNPPSANGVTIGGSTGAYFLSAGFDTMADLDTAYPEGTYSLGLERESGGTTSVTMQMPDISGYPPIPQLSNWTQAQMIDAAQDFELDFNSLGNPSADDLITIQIYDDFGRYVVDAPDLCLPIALPNDATTFVIPANTLAPDTDYTLRINFVRSFYASVTDPAQFASNGELQEQTVIKIHTTAIVSAPQIVSAGVRAGIFSFDVANLTPGVGYRLQANDSLRPENWTDLKLLDQGTPMPVVDADSGGFGMRFYRIVYP